MGATFFFEHLIDVFCYLLSFCYLLAEWLAVNTHACPEQRYGHAWSQWSLLWWLLKGEPGSWSSRHSVVIRFEETLFPAQKCFLSRCILVWKGIWSLFCNCYCTHTHHTHTHAQTHSFVQVVFSVSVWVSLSTQFLFPSEFWMEGNFSNQIVSSDWRPGNWGRFWKEGEARKKRALNWKNNFPQGAWAHELQRLYPPVSAGGQGTPLVSICAPYKHMSPPTHTSTHPSIYIRGLGWAGQ